MCAKAMQPLTLSGQQAPRCAWLLSLTICKLPLILCTIHEFAPLSALLHFGAADFHDCVQQAGTESFPVGRVIWTTGF